MNHRTPATPRRATADLSIVTSDPAAAGPALPDAADPVLAAFDAWARLAPDTVAVDEHGTRWSYAQIGAAATELADALRQRVRPGDVVGMCLERSALLVAATVALARLGAVQVLLGPRPAPGRLTALAGSLRLGCLLGDPGDGLPADRRSVEVSGPGRDGATRRLDVRVPVPGPGPEPATGPADLPSGTGPADLPPGARYAVLTSGSTGAPKVVLVGARSLARAVGWYRGRSGLRPGERQGLFMSTAFDAHFLELWGGLASGATLVVAPEEARSDPAALTDWWQRSRLTAALLPTPLAETVLDRPWPPGLPLRYLCIGGDRLRRWPGPDVTARADNVYGPSETTIAATFHPLDGEPADDRSGPPPIGRPLGGARAFVTDADGTVLGRGTPGELWIAGPTLALGYLDRELTGRRFPAAPEEAGGGRAYRTGDRAVMRADGVLEFLGRVDDQLKISGVRIEPAEVEGALERDARVSRAAVASPGGGRLLAFVLPAPGARPDEAELLALAAEWLPAQAVPSRVRLLDELPYDANGKVDRAALLAEDERRCAVEAEAAEAAEELPDDRASATRRRVLEHCRALLGNPALMPHDNFIRAGGTSIDIARLLAALERDTGVRLRAARVMRQPDLAAVAAMLDAAVSDAGTADRDRRPVLTATTRQEGEDRE